MTKYCSESCPNFEEKKHYATDSQSIHFCTGTRACCTAEAVTQGLLTTSLAADEKGWIRDPDCPLSDFALSQLEAEQTRFVKIGNHVVVECIVKEARVIDDEKYGSIIVTNTINMDHIVSATQQPTSVRWIESRRVIKICLVLHTIDGLKYTIDATMQEWIDFLKGIKQ